MGKIRYMPMDVKREKGDFLSRRQPRDVITLARVEQNPPCKGCGEEPRRNTSAYGVKCAEAHAKLQTL